MLAITVILTLLLSPSLVQNHPTDGNKNYDVYICNNDETGVLKPYIPDCNYYYYCENNHGILSRCKETYYFDNELQRCVINTGECGEVRVRTKASPREVTLPVCPPTPTCKFGEFLVSKPYPPDCEKFIYCNIRGEALIYSCMYGYHFSPETNSCQRRNEANCSKCIEDLSNSTTTSPITTAPTTTLKTTTAPTTTTQRTTTAKTTTAPTTTAKTTTTQRTTTTKTTTAPTTTAKTTTTQRTTTVKTTTAPTTTAKTTTTQRTTTAKTTTAPTTTAKTTTTQRTTTTKTTTSKTTTAKTTTSPSLPCPETPTCKLAEWGENKPYPPDCTKYIYCDDLSNANIRNCINNYEFSPSELQCLPSEEAMCPVCSDITTTPIPSCVPLAPCSKEEAGITKPYSPDCTMYLYCDQHGNSVCSKCPSSKPHFSHRLNYCTSIEEAKCETCGEPTAELDCTISTCPPTKKCTKTGDLLPYPPHCAKYIYCDGTENGMLSQCPFSEYFSPALSKCVHADEADCKFCIEKELNHKEQKNVKNYFLSLIHSIFY